MPSFDVKIHAGGEDLRRARAALRDAGIRRAAGPDLLLQLRLGRQLTAHVDAATPEAAVYRVSEKLPEGGDYRVTAELGPPRA